MCSIGRVAPAFTVSTLRAAPSAASGEQTQAQSTWAFGENPAGQILSRCGRMCIGPVWLAASIISQRVLQEVRFLGRLK